MVPSVIPKTVRLVYDEILRFLRALVVTGSVLEIRILKATRAWVDGRIDPRTVTLFGYFDAPEVAATAIAEALSTATFEAVLVTLNPVRSSLLARAENRLKVAGRGDATTGDADVERRRWLLIDIDPVRPSGISATDREKAEADAVADSLLSYLSEKGWPEPIIADSGNGLHALFEVDLPVDDAGLLRSVLEALAHRFDTEAAQVDLTVANPARLVKVYGTLAGKGDSTVDRPHRMSRLLRLPESTTVVSEELLRAVTTTSGEAGRQKAPRGGGDAKTGRPFQFEAFLGKFFPDARMEPWADGGTRWIVDPCPFDPAHTGSSAAILRLADGAISFRCLHNSCSDKGWRDVRRLFETSAIDEEAKHGAALLIELAEGYKKFHSPDGVAYADVDFDGRRETWPVRSAGFENLLRLRAWQSSEEAPSEQAVSAALGALEAMAIYDGECHPVYLRIGEHQGVVFLDLCDDDWRAVKVDEQGWSIVTNPPIRFRREPGMLPLPEPAHGGSLEPLRQLLNIEGDPWVLLAGWIVGSLNPKGPYAVLVLNGPQGSTKSTRSRMARGLFDPNAAPIRSLPRDERDLVIAARNSYLAAFDNVSRLQPWVSDAICRLATGAGFSTRELYSDTREVILSLQRPVLMNGVQEFVSRPDLLDRAITIELEPLPEAARRPESALFAEYEQKRPEVLGAFLDGVSAALRNRDLHLEKLPRLADFATWVSRAEEALGFERGAFLKAYMRNRDQADQLAIEASSIGAAILSFVEEQGAWCGTATDLLTELSGAVGEERRRSRSWPKRPKNLTDQIREILPNLANLGATVSFKRNRRARLIFLNWAPAGTPSPGPSLGSRLAHPVTPRDEAGDEELVAASRANPQTDEGGDERDADDEDGEDS